MPEDDSQLDRLILLLASQPREGWEDIYEEIQRREVERLAYKAKDQEELEPDLW